MTLTQQDAGEATSDIQSERYLAVSADTHAGPPLAAFEPYFDSKHAPDFASLVAADARLRAAHSASHYEKNLATSRHTDPIGREADLDQEGLAAEVVYADRVPFNHPSSATYGLPTPDAALRAAGCRAYNRWLVDLCSPDPARHAGVAAVPVLDIDDAVEEVEWAKENGLRGIQIPPVAPGFPAYHDLVYEPLWAACAALEMPVCNHGGGGGGVSYGQRGQQFAYAMLMLESSWFGRRLAPVMILSGVFERHSTLKLVFVEQLADWVPSTIADMDSVYLAAELAGLRDELPMRPSDYFARNVWIAATFMSPMEVSHRAEIGIEHTMWGSDYPHPGGAWPYTLESLRHSFAGVPPAEVRRLIGDNAIECWGFDRERLDAIATRIGPPVAEVSQPLPTVDIPEPARERGSMAFRVNGAWS